MKKLLLSILIIALPSCCYAKSYVDSQLRKVKRNVEYNSVQIHKRDYESNTKSKKESNIELIDPKLIKLTQYNPISDKDYEKKISKDNEKYKKYKDELSKSSNTSAGIDFYNIYRISERLIRANNLEYVNWRIAIRKSDEINAYSSDANYIKIYTSLYDSLYDNEDALAFVIAHEMAHLILGHQQQLVDTRITIEKLLMKRGAKASLFSLATYGATKAVIYSKYKFLRDMEYMADTEALILLTKAGYDPNKALGALNFLDSLIKIYSFKNDHPLTDERIESYKENMHYIDPNWILEGRENIYNSEVLPCKKSSDRVTLVITKSEKMNKFYEVEDMEKRLTRIAYVSYLNKDFKNSAKYFRKLSHLNESNYIPFLYLSLSNTYLYKELKDPKYLTYAQKSIEKAIELKPDDNYVIEQEKEILRLIK